MKTPKRRPWQVILNYVDLYGNAHAVTLRGVMATTYDEAKRDALDLYRKPHNQARVIDVREQPSGQEGSK